MTWCLTAPMGRGAWLLGPAVLLALALASCDEGGTNTSSPSEEPATPLVYQTKDWRAPRGGVELQGRVHDPVPPHPKVAWMFEADSDLVADAAVADGVVYVGSVRGTLYAIDAATGKKIWSFETDDTIEGAPTVALGRVFVGSDDNNFYALDARTGEEVWKLEGQDKFPSGANLVKSPDGREDWILVNGYDGVARCLRAVDGSAVWEYETSNYINGVPGVVDGQYVVFGGCDALVHVVKLKDGSPANQIETEAYIIESVATHGRMIYCSNYAYQVVAADVDGKEPKWIYSGDDHTFPTAPAVDEQHVYMGSQDKHLHAIDRETGQGVWKFKTGARVDSSPLVFDDAVVFGSNDGRLYAVRTGDGKELWRLDLGEELAAGPVFADGTLFIGGGDGTLFAVR